MKNLIVGGTRQSITFSILRMTLFNLEYSCPTQSKDVTIEMKALNEYILMVLFVLLLKRVHFLVNET